MEIELKGMTEMITRLRAAQVQVSGPGMDKALRAGGRVIRDAMRERCPIGPPKTSKSTALAPGRLKADIKVRLRKDEDGERAAFIGPGEGTAYVARFVEYGHRLVKGGYLKILANGRSRGTGQVIDFVPADPFLRPAFDASLGEAEEAMALSLSGSIKEAVK